MTVTDMKSLVKKNHRVIASIVKENPQYELSRHEVEGEFYPVFKKCPDDFNQLLDRGRSFSNQTAIVYQDRSLTYSSFFEQLDRVASLLLQQGINKGDHVAIAMRNYPEWLVVFCGIIRVGAVAVPLNSWSLSKELEYLLNDSDAKLVFCDSQRFELVNSYLDESSVPAIVVGHNDKLDSPIHKHYNAWLDNSSPYSVAPSCNGDDTVMIMYSSGTTGYPKGIVWNHRTLSQAIYSFCFLGEQMALLEPEAVKHFSDKKLQASNLLAVPLFHFNGLGSTSLLSLITGQKIVFMYKWDPLEALQLIEREKITGLRISPAMALELLEHQDIDQYDLSSIFAFGSGGSATPTRLHGLIESVLPQAIGSGGYGTTETAIGVSSIIGEVYKANPRSSGLITPLTEVRILDDNGKQLPFGETGEIYVRSIGTASGRYWRNPEETKQSFIDGWFVTGDVGYIDEDGFLYITDRIKDMVIRGGENIYCTEIENAVYEYSSISEAVAFGIPHKTLGEELAVAIYCSNESIINVDQIRDFLSRRCAHYKVPKHIFVFTDPLPRNPSGKFLKRVIRDSCLKFVD